MTAQANMLVDRMIGELGQSVFESSWKMVNFFIGGNDLCDYCNDQVDFERFAFLLILILISF